MIVTPNLYGSPFANTPFVNTHGAFQQIQQSTPKEQPRELSLPRVINYLAK